MASFRERLERAVERAHAAKKQRVVAHPWVSPAEPSHPPPAETISRSSRPPPSSSVPPPPPPVSSTRYLPVDVCNALRTFQASLEDWAASSVARVEDEQRRVRVVSKVLEAETRRADKLQKTLEVERKRHAEELARAIPTYKRSIWFVQDAEAYVREHINEIVASWLASDAGKERMANESVVAYQLGKYEMQQGIYTALRQKDDAFNPEILELPVEMENPELETPADMADTVAAVASSVELQPTVVYLYLWVRA